MATLPSNLRRQLESVIVEARDKAEAAARSALQKRAVDAAEPFEHFTPKEREMRVRLRARGRQVGDVRQGNKTQTIDQLTQELAYEYWHRMLFARFLAENHLLMHPDGIAVSLEECEELASHEGAANGFELAARYASKMLPQIFRTDDALLEIEFPINDRLPLEKLLASIPKDTFTADDSLGWVYQFWQSKRKDEVNATGEKIDGHTLPAVTQLFTEPYMVKFLLHNTIGAWWCARHNIKGPPGGAGVPNGQCPVELEYLRWQEDGTPAAGTFDGWPVSLKDFTMMDPCCGSGHFLVEAFNILVALRMQEEDLSALEACDSVLSENLFGLELDQRCTQIAAFALALAAWKSLDETGEQLGYRNLPPLNIACSGQGVTGKKDEWLALANGESRLREGMDKLYDLFKQAPHLGSLIDPSRETGDLIAAAFSAMQPLLKKALETERMQQDADAQAIGIAAQGIAKAADLLTQQYTLIATNVPYLGRGAHGDVLMSYADEYAEYAKSDLATLFAVRCLNGIAKHGTCAIVTPQNWWFLHSYAPFRKRVLQHYEWNAAVSLGEEAWHTFGIRGPRTVLLVLTNLPPTSGSKFVGINVSSPHDGPIVRVEQKAELLRGSQDSVLCRVFSLTQKEQLTNPDCRIIIGEHQKGATLGEYVAAGEGCSTGDNDRFVRNFWEVKRNERIWIGYAGADGKSRPWHGREKVMRWDDGSGPLASSSQARIQNTQLWHVKGLLIGRIRGISSTIFVGGAFDKACVVLAPRREDDLLAIYAFVMSGEYERLVRELDQKVAASTSVMTSVSFDIEEWKRRSQEMFPGGLPEPYQNDPTQWDCNGLIAASTDPLQVAVARMVGYRWPEQSDRDNTIDALTDSDGITCIPAVRGERPASERILDILRAAHAEKWSNSLLGKLIAGAGGRAGMSLDAWLRGKFFEQHCKTFGNRPFIWHIWDGHKDGFSCLVNYHNLTHKLLETLTYSYVQDWINNQEADAKKEKPGADLRLAAAQGLQSRLKQILEGEPPYDIFVRWKPLSDQPIGWNPDLNDGVRINIRPLMTAEVLRKNPNVKWTKDRGKETDCDPDEYPWFWENGEFTGNRVNDVHLTNAEKRAAREKAKAAK